MIIRIQSKDSFGQSAIVFYAGYKNFKLQTTAFPSKACELDSSQAEIEVLQLQEDGYEALAVSR